MNIRHASSTEANKSSATRNVLSLGIGGRKFVWAALVVVALGSGCATPQQPTSEPAPVAKSLTRHDGAVRVDTDNPEAARLWASAERAMADGRPEIAQELIYEALDIDPQNSLLWSRAAELQLDTLELELAENFALRSNQWAGDNRTLLYRNWLIIEHARSMRGDLLGVRSAHKQVQSYQNK